MQNYSAKFKIIFAFFCVAFLCWSPSNAGAQVLEDSETIVSFSGEIIVNSDSTINVREIIQYNFEENERHGIFRFIPIKYKARGGNFSLRISSIQVTDEKGVPYNFAVSYPGKNVEIKIGDADKLVSGQKSYVVNYVIDRAINYFSDHDELYWNFTGDEWQVPIEKASVNVILSDNASQNLQYKCFEGPFGSTNECFASVEKNYLTFQATKPLVPGEGMTIVAGWPKGITALPTFWQKMSNIILDNWSVFVPLLVFAAMFWIWYKKGRDPKGRGTIIVQYEPPSDLAPAEIATVLHGYVRNEDISATIIDLAVRGYIKIKRIEESGWLRKNIDYEFTRLKEELPSRNFEETVMDGIFKGETARIQKLSDLKNKFYKYVGIVQEKIYNRITNGGFYMSNPRNVIIFWVVAAMFAGTILTIILGQLQGVYGVTSGIASGIIMLFFGWLMPVVTTKGAQTKENILGFKDFLAVAETDRIKFHNAPEKNSEMFEKFLPYALVLGVEKEWAKQFEGIYNQQPNWYEDSSGRAFNAIILSNIANDFSSSAISTLTSQPSSAASGGSGFSGGGSGGGGGGGGGGSW